MDNNKGILSTKVKELFFLCMVMVVALVTVVPNVSNTYKADDRGLLGIIDVDIDITDSWEAKHNSRANAYVKYMDDGKTPSYYYINNSGMLTMIIGPYIGPDNSVQPEVVRELTAGGYQSLHLNNFKSGDSNGLIILNVGVADRRTKPFGYYTDPEGFKAYQDFVDEINGTQNNSAPKPTPKPAPAPKPSPTTKPKTNTNSEPVVNNVKSNSTNGASNHSDNGKDITSDKHPGNSTSIGAKEVTNDNHSTPTNESKFTLSERVKQEDLPMGIEITDSGIVDTNTGQVIEVNTDTLNMYKSKRNKVSDYHGKNVNDIDIITRGGDAFPLLDEDNISVSEKITLEGAGQEKLNSNESKGFLMELVIGFFNSLTNKVKALF